MASASRRLSVRCAALGVIVLLAGALIWWRPFLTHAQLPIAETPAPPPVNVLSAFAIPPHQRACMSSITITPDSYLATFVVRPNTVSASGGPPLDLSLVAPGYRTSLLLRAGYPGGTAALPMSPPHKAVIGKACFSNLGSVSALLTGTTETRTLSRPQLTINGRAVTGDIWLTFYERQPRRLISHLGQIFRHASNLTDGLLPPWGIWFFALLAALGIPVATLLAFYRAVREDVDYSLSATYGAVLLKT